MLVFIVRKLIIVLFFVCSLSIYAQESNLFFIRNYQYSNVILLAENTNSQLVLDAYGNNQIHRDYSPFNSKYTFQGQEYDAALNLYFFPSRLYAQKSCRFIQPDPLSQYHSPYLFVNADPINLVDLDGKAGKPLILYGQESRYGTDKTNFAVAEDLSKEVDGYYSPISDFVNGKFPTDLQEWNGNVFVVTHTRADGSIVGEYYGKGEAIQTAEEHLEKIDVPSKGFRSALTKPSSIAERIGELSEVNKVPVGNITVSGCEGAEASSRLVEATSKELQRRGLPSEVKGMGLKPGRWATYSHPSGWREAEMKYFEMHGEYSDVPRPDHTYMAVRYDTRGDIDEIPIRSNERLFRDMNTGRYLPTVQPAQMDGFVNGRVPRSAQGDFASYTSAIADL